MLKFKLAWIGYLVALLSGTFLISQVYAQSESEYTLQLLATGENGSVVSHRDFPLSSVELALYKDGEIDNKPRSRNEFRLIEDGRVITPTEAELQTPPVETTIVYQFVDYLDIDNYSDYQASAPHIEAFEKIRTRLQSTARLTNLCLTMVSDVDPAPCTRVTGDFGDLKNDFVRRTTYNDPAIVNSLTLVNHQTIWDSILSEKSKDKPHQVIWIIDDDILNHGMDEIGLLPANESQLLQIYESHGSLMIIDLTETVTMRNNATWKRVLATKSVRHMLSAGGMNFPNSSCSEWISCMDETVEQIRPHTHKLTYESALLSDNQPHTLRVQLISTNPGTVLAQERTDFVISPALQSDGDGLKPIVSRYSICFNGVSLFVLIMVLLLIKRPDKVGETTP